MREIKFRAWDGKKMYENIPVYEMVVLKENVEIMQFTGLHDKNGKEIYEGDIVIIRFTGGGERKGQIYKKCEVKWGIYDIGCNGREYDYKVVGPYVEDEFTYSDMIDGKVEVIGNIYENPDLLLNQE